MALITSLLITMTTVKTTNGSKQLRKVLNVLTRESSKLAKSLVPVRQLLEHMIALDQNHSHSSLLHLVSRLLIPSQHQPSSTWISRGEMISTTIVRTTNGSKQPKKALNVLTKE